MKPFFSLSVRALSLSAGLATLLLAPALASACGGFFCNNTTPTVQTGERILFTVEEDAIRAYVQVYYDGPADDFAWVVPVATVPEVGVGTDEVFTSLDQLTSPQFQIDYQIEESCYDQGAAGGVAEFAFDSANGAPLASEDDSAKVTVLAEGKTGPYNYQIVDSNDAEVLVAWLNENDYEQPPEALPLIQHYIAKEMKFVAVKLLPNKDAGDIAPIILDFQEQGPCIPLVLTSVAAQENMPVKAYVLGNKRAVPTNWLHVDVNLKKLDWFAMETSWWGSGGFGNLNSNYEKLLIEAIGEAEGHAFTTEYAGSSERMNNQLDFGQYNDVENLLSIDHPGDFVMALQNYFSGSDQLLNLLQKYIPAPEGVDEQDFYNWPENYFEQYDELEVDLEAFYQELLDVIVKPVQEAQDMFDSFPYLTRLYSRVSVDAMDRDPIFAFEDGGDVSNVHTAIFHLTCSGGSQDYYMELENGETFVPENPPTDWYNIDPTTNRYSNGSDLAAEPAAESIELFVPGEGAKAISPEDVAYVEEQLTTKAPEDVEVPAFDPSSAPAEVVFNAASDEDGGCSTGSESPMPWAALALLAGVLGIRLRVWN